MSKERNSDEGYCIIAIFSRRPLTRCGGSRCDIGFGAGGGRSVRPEYCRRPGSLSLQWLLLGAHTGVQRPGVMTSRRRPTGPRLKCVCVRSDARRGAPKVQSSPQGAPWKRPSLLITSRHLSHTFVSVCSATVSITLIRGGSFMGILTIQKTNISYAMTT